MPKAKPDLKVVEKLEDKVNKNQALESAVSLIEKTHGKGSVMKLGSNQKIDIETVEKNNDWF